MSRLLRAFAVAAFAVLCSTALCAQWVPLGPDGGDVRSLAADPQKPNRIYLGTSAGQLFLSENGGQSWNRLAHLGAGDDYVLDHILVDPDQPSVVYAAAWSVENNGGDIFRSDDSGKTWRALPGMHGKSVRAFAMAPRDPNFLVAGALDGVFRSRDGGQTWEQISPPHHAEIKNIESLAIDPRDPEVIYAGTWHLPWKTYDGGRTWQNIKRGVIDDSDVFSIIVDRTNPLRVYLSACSGIYVSNDAGMQFRKVQGIPYTARRTRVLRQDLLNPNVVYAGTTEGLFKTSDAGRTWTQATASNLIVNDVLVDPRDAQRVLLATDRSGVLASNDAARSFVAANRGFSHRQVSTVVADRADPSTLYAGMVNDEEFGGVFVSHDSGSQWQQMSAGLQGRDVFCLQQADNGDLLAGTNQGIFRYSAKQQRWEPINLILTARELPQPRKVRSRRALLVKTELIKSQLTARVAQIATTPRRWFAATGDGLLESLDQGRSWHPLSAFAGSFVSVDASNTQAIAATASAVYQSADSLHWNAVRLPQYVTAVYHVAVADKQLWISTREGAFYSDDNGDTWQHVIAGARNLSYVSYDANAGRLLGVAGNEIFESRDAGRTWTNLNAGGYGMRALSVAGPRVLGITAFDGLVAQGESEAAATRRATSGSTNNQ